MKRTKQDKRPSSDNFVDVHLFVVPHELWMEKYRTAYNNSTLESISAGFVRVPPALSMCDLRIQVKEQLGGGEVIPDDYVFLRCVGRCLAIVSKAQEFSLKVKHFLPPIVSAPEIFVLFGTHESLSQSLTSSLINGSDVPEYVGRSLNSSRDLDNGSRCSTECCSGNESPEINRKDDNDTRENSGSASHRRVHFENTSGFQNLNNDKNNMIEPIKSKTGVRNSVEYEVDEDKVNHGENIQNDIDNTSRYFKNLPSQDATSEHSSHAQSPRRRQHSGQRYVQNTEDSYKHSENDRITQGQPKMQQPNVGQSKVKQLKDIKTNFNENPKETEVAVGILHNEPGTTDVDTKQDYKQLLSNQDLEHGSSVTPRNNTQRKNPLVHSKTVPALFEYSSNEAKNTDQSENVEPKGGDEINDSSLNKLVNDENNDNLVNISTDNDLDICTNNDFNKPRSTGDITPRSTGDITPRTYSNTRESTGKENKRREKENDLGITMADKENLVLQLQAELSAVRIERSNSEKTREQLLKKAKNLQNQNNQKKTQARNIWKKRYFEEKKTTVSLEERCNQLRYEVDVLHKKLLSSMDSKDYEGINSPVRHEGDPEKVNNKIMLSRKENEVEELKRRVEEAKIKLGSEMKLRDTAQKELKHLRDEVIDKKINATLVKKSLSLLETRPSNMQI